MNEKEIDNLDATVINDITRTVEVISVDDKSDPSNP